MILERLSLTNFRQFRGVQIIEFSADPSRDNVTVVLGENGRGKTGLYRALMFCLFGDRGLPQDEGTPTGSLLLVNSSAVRSAKDPVEASVTVEFTHGDSRYKASRSLLGLLNGNRQVEELRDVSLSVTGHDGNTSIFTDPRGFDSHIQGILDPRVKDYFLFDGEKIERLTRATAEQRDEVARGIRTLLSVDALEKAIVVSNSVVDHFEKQIDDDIDVERQRIAHRLSETRDQLHSVSEQIEQSEREELHAEREVEEMDKRLAGYEEVRELVEQRRSTHDEVDRHQVEIERYRSDMGEAISPTSQLLIMPMLSEVYNEIDASKSRGEIPPEIKRDLIEKLLEEESCICGRPLAKGSNPWEKILEWYNRVGDTSVHDAALELWRDLARLTKGAASLRERAEGLLFQYGNACNLKEQALRRIERLDEQIGGSQREDAAQLEEQREAVAHQLEKTRIKLHVLRTQQNDLESERQRLQAELREKDAELKRSSVTVARADLARGVHQALDDVFHDFTEGLRRTISGAATEYFHRLVGEDSQRALQQVVVDGRYSLEVRDKFDQDFLANISAGQRQLVSIAFILALAEAAGGTAEGPLPMPLFMDTPFGRLDFGHRRSLLLTLPDECSQWVLLVTGTEFTRSEARILRNGSRWSRAYRLEATDDGSTEIRQFTPDDIFPVLNEGGAAK